MNSDLQAISMGYQSQPYFLPGIIYEDISMSLADTSSCFYPSLPLPQLFSSFEDYHQPLHTELSPDLSMVGGCFIKRERFSSLDSLPPYVPRQRFASQETIQWTPSILPSNNIADPLLPCHTSAPHMATTNFMWNSSPKSLPSEIAKRSKSFQCNICLKNFDRKFVLKRHMGTHKVDKDYSCKPCNMGFYRKDIFDRHIATKKCIKAHRAHYGPRYQPPSSSPGANVKSE